ncbi:methylated-DNA-[protein]-cysteine S-methyltransferase [Treponema maltophilum ATCC 51939]|uniref:Methylated-DNA--protein-cysteine methyltransferase n=1 Tax=Treponema maltophilum ATCC 51939 TaxID=1125699 RepID=S3JY60_TREMA|nr:methylated-DNA-[protein]-cysteine S-methyltransferase [Treponema maltophilum ATCC 51939]
MTKLLSPHGPRSFRDFIVNFIHRYDSPLGGITEASDGKSLIGLWFDGQKYFADTLDSDSEEKRLPAFEQTDRWLDIYFSGREPVFTPPLSMEATAFRKAVWKIMLKIPYGHTMTYGEIADKIAKQKNIAHMSAQAVGGAVAHNPVSLIIPCHRVVGTNGSLTGYAGGIDKKVKLLTLERADMSSFFIPKKGTAL